MGKKLIEKLKNFVLSAMLLVVFCVPFCIFVPQTTNIANAGLKDFFSSIFGQSTQDSSQCENLISVYLGGMPLGFTLECRGVIVIAVGEVHTSSGVVSTITEGNILNGDVITKIDGVEITSYQTISREMKKQEINNQNVKLDIDRNGISLSASILPAKDVITGEYKLGLWIRDNSAGVGTLTYVRADNNRLGAIGHSVCDVDTGTRLPLLGGNVYKCNIIGVTPSTRGSAGELKGLFLRSGNMLGSLDKNTDYGVFGTANEELLASLGQKVFVAPRSAVKTGKASIFCCIDGTRVEEFSVEIVKTTKQSAVNCKSMIIRITDQNLIDKTGGIVQGMSGSPIVQNGMLVGAVTHVFVSDPTKGYGIYAQWMIDN